MTRAMPSMTPKRLRGLKGKAPFATVTVFDTTSARIADRAGLPLLLVGDSLGNTILGLESTLNVTMDHMVHHTAASARGVEQALLVADLPFLSYQITEEDALRNAGRLIQEGHADAVKLEGGADRCATIRRMVSNGIPVMGHIGLTPQSVKEMGYTVQGRNPERAEELKQDAVALQEAGVFSIVLEACPPDLAREITASLEIPTVGIGAGPDCDGQILVFNDLMGLSDSAGLPKFVKPYAQIGEQMDQALKAYASEVATKTFPGPEQTY